MSVAKLFLERVENLGLLDEKVLGQLRKQVDEAKGPVAAETLAKVLVDNGHLTVFQAKKIVAEVSAVVEAARAKAAAKPASSAPTASTTPKPKAPPPPKADDDLMLADDGDGLELLEDAPAANGAAELGADDLELLDDDDDGLELIEDEPPAKTKPVTPPKPTPAAKTTAAAAPTGKAAAPKSTAPSQPATKPTAVKPTAPKPTTVAPAPKTTPATPSRPKTPVAPAPALTPLDDDGLEVIDEGLEPLDDALVDDPLMSAAASASALGGAKKLGGALAGPRAKQKKNPWDSALIYVGGGALALLIFAFAVLYLSLSRGSANESFQLAEDDYKAQAYAQAIAKYEKYLSRFSDDTNASLARVRIGMAQIHLAVAESKDTGEALAITKETLERIEPEERFEEARAELADVLPGMANKLAQQARRSTTDVPKATALIAQADDALAMVNNGSFIPPNLRQPVEAQVSAIAEEISFVKRELDQDKQLQTAVADMSKATEAGNTRAATDVRREFLKRYPGLDANAKIVEATLAIAKKEQELVTVAQETLSPSAAAVQSPVTEFVLSDHQGEAAGDSAAIVAMTLRGAVYGVNAATGKIAWRHYVGLETTAQPTPVGSAAGDDILIVNRRTNDLVRIKNADGAVAWRLPLGEPCASPTIVGAKALVTADAGKVIEVDLASGESSRRAQLPQGAIQSAGFDPRRKYVYQLGEHSNLFVLSAETLACSEVVFLGHLPGGIAAPPVVTGGQVFVAHNVGSDYSLVHVLSADAEGLNLTKKRDPVRLKGHVVTPPIVDGRRVYVFTNLGAAHVFDVDPANVTEPVTDVTRLVATRKEPILGYAGVSEGRVWLGDERMTLYELQPAKKELVRKWSRFEGETFLAPPQRVGESLITARWRPKVGDVVIAGLNPADGAAHWRTNVAVPVTALVTAGDSALALNASGSAFALQGDGGVLEPSTRIGAAGDPPRLTTALEVGGRPVLAASSEDAQWAVFDIQKSPPKVILVKRVGEAAQVTAAPIAFESGLLLPLSNGQVALVDALNGKPLALPFQPKLEPGKLPAWRKPLAIQGAAATFAIAHDNTISLGTRREQPQPHLAVVKEVASGGILRGELAQLDDSVITVVEEGGQYLLKPLTLPDLSPGEPIKLSSDVAFGPRRVGDALLMATDTDGLMLLQTGLKTKWTLPLEGASVAGVGASGDDLIVTTTLGEVWRVRDGKVIKRVTMERPITGDPLILGQTLWCAGADGAAYSLPLTALEE